MTKRGLLVAGAVLCALPVAGCGSGGDYTNRLRPPAPIVVSAYISDKAVSLSPLRFGAGPITIVATNQSGASQQLTLETAGRAAGIRQSMGPINPSDTGTMKASVLPGLYLLRASGAGVRPGVLRVRGVRPSAQNDLQLP